MSHNRKERMSRVSEGRRVEDGDTQNTRSFPLRLYSEAIGLAGMAQKRSPCFRRAAFIAAVARAMREDLTSAASTRSSSGSASAAILATATPEPFRPYRSRGSRARSGPGRASREARATTEDFTNSRRGGPSFEGGAHDEHDAGR
jgi:hypothetical protein